MILETWKQQKPEEFLAYQQLLRDKISLLANANGMSKGRLMRYRADIPTALLCIIRDFVPDWVDQEGKLAKLEGWLMGPLKPEETKAATPMDWSMYEPEADPGSDVRTPDPDLGLRDSEERAEEHPEVSPGD
jgi:hypothetical protein